MQFSIIKLLATVVLVAAAIVSLSNASFVVATVVHGILGLSFFISLGVSFSPTWRWRFFCRAFVLTVVFYWAICFWVAAANGNSHPVTKGLNELYLLMHGNQAKPLGDDPNKVALPSMWNLYYTMNSGESLEPEIERPFSFFEIGQSWTMILLGWLVGNIAMLGSHEPKRKKASSSSSKESE